MSETKLSYEQARAELIDCVKKLEAGVPTLDESLVLWERGEELADLCSEYLTGAQERLAQRTGASVKSTD